MLSSCAETEIASTWWKGFNQRSPQSAIAPSQQEGLYKVGNPYRAAGKWYTPVESYSYDETGISSWYGDEFHGKRTANGEIFDKNALTAAHPTLQMPSLIRVTNLQNGRSAVLRVNDRGPFARSRLIDVSHHAAEVLGFMNTGTARVRVQVLERESRIVADAARKGYSPAQQMAMAFSTPATTQTTTTTEVASATGTVTEQKVETAELTTPTPVVTNVTKQDIDDLNKKLFKKFPVSPTSIYVQVGAFSSMDNANALKVKLASFGHAEVYPSTVNGQSFNRVRLGPLQSVPTADTLLSKVIKAGYPAARIIVD